MVLLCVERTEDDAADEQAEENKQANDVLNVRPAQAHGPGRAVRPHRLGSLPALQGCVFAD